MAIWTRTRGVRRSALAAVAVAMTVAATAPPPASAAPAGRAETERPQPTDDRPRAPIAAPPGAQAPAVEDKGRSGPADDALREAVAAEVEAQRRRAAVPGGDAAAVAPTTVAVEVLHELSTPDAEALVARHGGTVTGGLPSGLVQAAVPVTAIGALESEPGIRWLRAVRDRSAPRTDGTGSLQGTRGAEAVNKTGAGAWHAGGLNGTGVRVGIIDSFSGTYWNEAMAAGEVPAAAGTFCQQAGSRSCSVWNGGSRHGLGVAEAVHDMAPGASLYVASVWGNPSDLRAAIDWFADNGVRIVTMSLGFAYDGAGRGDGPFADVVDHAVSRGITFLVAAGNSSGDVATNRAGGYWRTFGFRDTDGDSWMDFPTGGELLAFYCGGMAGFRWDDWGDDPTDYDIYVFDTPSSTTAKDSSLVSQRTGVDPIEWLGLRCSSSSDIDYLAVYRYSAGNGTSNDTLEFLSWTGVQGWSNPYSAAESVVDSRNAGSLAVGAVDPAMGTTIAPYSSWGPTNDGRNKPDLSAASCISSFTYRNTSSGCFNGTSAATPVTAGAAALALQRWPGSTPAQLANWLRTGAVVDRGSAGTDTIFGTGELRLPAPNDEFARSTRLSGSGGSATSSTVNATAETSEPSHSSGAAGRSIWFTWTAPYTGTARFRTAGSGFDTVLGVYTGSSVGALTRIAANDDVSGIMNSSEVRIPVTAGTTYRIAVDGYQVATGSVRLTYGAVGPFDDVAAGSWADAPVDWMKGRGITAGYSGDATRFAPDRTLTRAELAVILWRHAGSPSGAPSTFTDVPTGSWYATAVGWLQRQGLTTGYAGNPNRFAPSMPVDRAQTGAFLYRLAGSPDPGPRTHPFTDVPTSAYYAAAVDWLFDRGITTGLGSPTTFGPAPMVTRGQTAALVHRWAVATGRT